MKHLEWDFVKQAIIMLFSTLIHREENYNEELPVIITITGINSNNWSKIYVFKDWKRE